VDQKQNRTIGLLGTVVIIFVVLPLTRSGSQLATVIGAVLFSAVILGGLWAVSERRRQLIVAIVLMAPAFVFTILHNLVESRPIEITWLITNGFALGFLVALLLRRLFRTGRVTADTLSSAISGYFLLGILWAFAYAFLLQLDPGAFGAVEGDRASDLFYFSFVTLTTLGYGDITPASDAAQTLAILEAVVGQLYLAITLARLVGLHIAGARSK
jgi:hypothetical protein